VRKELGTAERGKESAPPTADLRIPGGVDSAAVFVERLDKNPMEYVPRTQRCSDAPTRWHINAICIQCLREGKSHEDELSQTVGRHRFSDEIQVGLVAR